MEDNVPLAQLAGIINAKIEASDGDELVELQVMLNKLTLRAASKACNHSARKPHPIALISPQLTKIKFTEALYIMAAVVQTFDEVITSNLLYYVTGGGQFAI